MRLQLAGWGLVLAATWVGTFRSAAALDFDGPQIGADSNVISRAALTARVELNHGVPELRLNGVRTAPRIFYGGVGWVPLRVQPGVQAVDFEFRAISSEERAGLDIHFDPTPGTIVLDDFELSDLTAGGQPLLSSSFDDPAVSQREWGLKTGSGGGGVHWITAGGSSGSPAAEFVLGPGSSRGPNPALHYRSGVKLRKGHRYRVKFWLKSDSSQGVSVMLYRPGAEGPTQILGAGGEPFFPQVELAAKFGVAMVTFPVRLPWPKPGFEPDDSYADDVCDYILAANPNALLIPRINVNAPNWWLDAHPADEMQWEGERINRTRAATVASPTYRQEAGHWLAAVVEHLERRYGGKMAGYHVAGGNSNEWFYEDSHSAALNGYAPADAASWRLWLEGRYHSDEALRAAWQSTAAHLASVPVPAPAVRRSNVAGTFHDPITDRAVLDWNQYQQDTMADTVCEFAHVVRSVTQGRKLVLFFYGYLFELADIRMGPTNSGHYALRRVLRSPDIDILCAPISYVDRNTGGSAPAMSAAESVALAGKLWVMEDDTSTHLSLPYINPPGSEYRTHSLAETNQVLLRNDAECALRNMGTWWMDLCRNGWFQDPQIWESHARLEKLEQEMIRSDRPFLPEVAAVIDESSMLLLTPYNRATRPISVSRAALGRIGAPYGQYLQDDLLAGRVSAAKLYVFLNPWRLSPEERKGLLSRTQGKVRVWDYASGWFDRDRASLPAIEELTGFRVKIVAPDTQTVTPSARGRAEGIPVTPSVASRAKPTVRPLFAATDASADEILGTFPDGTTALAVRRTPAGISIFCGTPDLSPELLRFAARLAGVHLYVNGNAAVYANGPFLAIHGTENLGPVEVDFGGQTPIRDELSGASLGTGPRLKIEIERGQTQVFRY